MLNTNKSSHRRRSRPSFTSATWRPCWQKRLVLKLSIGHQCYRQLTPVKTRYPLTSITWPYSGLKLDHIEVSCFFEVDRWPGTCCWLDRRLKPGQILTQTPDRGLIFRVLSVARRGYRAMLRQQKLLTVDAFRVQVRFGKYIFLASFRWFQSRFNII